MIWRILLTGLCMAIWSAVALAVGLANSLPGTEPHREIWTAQPVLWWALIACGPMILLAGSVWAARAKRKE